MAVKMNDAVAWTQGPRSVGLSDKPDVADISKPVRHEPAFDGIDWSAAAPGWLSIFAGLFLPLLALALLVVSIDLALVWLFERWIDPSSNMSNLEAPPRHWLESAQSAHDPDAFWRIDARSRPAETRHS